jgi:hypothetical protein
MDDERASASARATITAAETARYIAEFSEELAVLARHARLNALACLLDVVRLEARQATRSVDRP